MSDRITNAFDDLNNSYSFFDMLNEAKKDGDYVKHFLTYVGADAPATTITLASMNYTAPLAAGGPLGLGFYFGINAAVYVGANYVSEEAIKGGVDLT